jgi:hypothetical protein
MCNKCYSTIANDIDVIERKDLLEDGYEDEIEE